MPQGQVSTRCICNLKILSWGKLILSTSGIIGLAVTFSNMVLSYDVLPLCLVIKYLECLVYLNILTTM